ncbi:MAG: PDZ domain-containing protein [Planctomycetota bacterium]
MRSKIQGFPSLLLITLVTIGVTLLPSVASAQESAAGFRNKMATAIRAAAERVLPSIVTIEVIGVAEVGGQQTQSEVSQDAPTCGIAIDENHILASDIVVRRPSASILVVLPDQNRFAATVVARDHHRGVVLLKVKTDRSGSNLTPLELPDRVETSIGSTVIAVGRYGLDGSPIVSNGILSATERLEGTMLQCDARVSPSFYGGALVDLYGNPIGLLVPAVAEGGAPDETSWYDSGIAFAVPTPVIAKKLERLFVGDDIKKGLIGIVPKSTDPYAEDTELAAVRARSPAEKAGLKPGDVVQSVAGVPVRMFGQIKQALGPHDAGEVIPIKVRRGDDSIELSVKLADNIPPLRPQRLGIWVDEESQGEGDERKTTVVVRGVIPGTAADGTLKPGDSIESFDGSDVSDAASLRRMLMAAIPDQSVPLKITRDGEDVDVTAELRSIAGPALDETIPGWVADAPETAWKIQELRLPDASNAAALVAPPADDAGVDALAMLVLVLPPEDRDPKKTLELYREVAARCGVVVVAVASEDEKRWKPAEVDVVARTAKTAQQRVAVQPSAVALASAGAIAGVDASAADAMVIAIALSDRKVFAGISVSGEARPPAVRLRQNEPDAAMQILVPIDSLDDGPTWLAPLAGAGFPIILGGNSSSEDLFRWARLLQTI